MPVYVLDTTTLTHLERAHPRVEVRYRAAVADNRSVGTTTVNVEEVIGGWVAQLRRCRTAAAEALASDFLAGATRLLGQLAIYPVTVPALARFDQLKKQNLNVGTMDLKIAAVALELGATVVTDNLRDFGRVPQLAVEDWLA
jgi:tRNA(fMet)-specific endonuclease VapC